mmetsp:Transcript_13159/g.29280  ORF Transcript_13159/g.29280 Transcript_13159/m.29280 type:complete len:285 (-) Transcript_13159:101-955(-)
MAHQVAQATRHVEAWVAGILGVDAVVRIAIKHNTTSSFLDSGTLVLQVGLVIAGQSNAVKLFLSGALAESQDCRGVSHVGHREAIVDMVVQSDGGGGARQLGTQLFHSIRCANQGLRLLENVLQHGLPIASLETSILDDQLWQILLHELRHIMTLLSVPIENSIDGDLFHLQHKPGVLVGAFRLQSLSASVAHATRHRIDLIPHLLHSLVCEGGLALVSVGTNAHLSTTSFASRFDEFDDVLLVKGRNETSILFLGLRLSLVSISFDMANAQTTTLGLRGLDTR